VLVADDLGESAETNEGVARALAAGAVRETSLMVTGAAAEEGARRALQAGAGIGLHLSFTEGRALTGPLQGLTRNDGRFLGLGTVLLSCRLGVPRPAEVRREVEAQWARLLALGVTPTHLNGHHHAHAFPRIRDAVCAVAKERGIPYLRVPVEPATTGGWASPRRLVVSRQGRGLVKAMEEAGLAPPGIAFAGIALERRRDFGPRLEATLAKLPAGPAEVMVHPCAGSRLAEAETTYLADPGLPARLAASGWRPATLAEALAGSGP
jgi:predicted glycoside hydrolase/deacetylase ChbG (UPF0249 family)